MRNSALYCILAQAKACGYHFLDSLTYGKIEKAIADFNKSAYRINIDLEKSVPVLPISCPTYLGPVGLPDLPEKINRDPWLIVLSTGWLARENKVNIDPKDPPNVSLNR